MIYLRTYPRVWNYEKKIYSIENIRLIVPINPGELVYFGIGIAIMAIVSSIIPGTSVIPFLLRYFAFPYLLMKFLTKKKFDGKLPHMFLVGYIKYLMLPKQISRFQAGQRYKKGKFKSVSYRDLAIVNATEAAIRKKGEKKKNV